MRERERKQSKRVLFFDGRPISENPINILGHRESSSDPMADAVRQLAGEVKSNALIYESARKETIINNKILTNRETRQIIDPRELKCARNTLRQLDYFIWLVLKRVRDGQVSI